MKSFLTNIFLLGLSKGLFLPFWIIFLFNQGYSLLQIGILGTILEIVRFITEVPFGVVADKYGRKMALSLSSVLNFIGVVLLIISTSSSEYLILILSTIVMGFADSFESGAVSAWLADYLIMNNRSEQIESQLTKTYIIMIIGSIIGAVSISILCEINPIIPFYISAALFMGSFVTARFFMIETLSQMNGENEVPLSGIQILKKSYKNIRSSKHLRLLSYCFMFYAFGLDGIERFYQTFLNGKGFNIAWVSNIFIISSLLSIALMLWQNKLTKNIKKPLLVVGFSKIIMAGCVVLALYTGNIVSYVLIVLFFTLEISIKPILQTYLNNQIESEIRATTLSFFELVGSFGEMFAGFGIGALMKYFGEKMGFSISATGIILAALFIMIAHIYARRDMLRSLSSTSKDVA